MRVTIYKNIMRGRLEIRAFRNEGKDLIAMVNGKETKVDQFQEIPIALSLPINTEIENGLEPTDYKKLLDQKHIDKEDHAHNLNQIIDKLINKITTT